MAEQPSTTQEHEHESHPNYVMIGVILAVVTVAEVAITWFALPPAVMDTALILFAVAKALFVVGWYMHLKFDSRIYTIVFMTGILFTLLLATTFMLLF